MFDRGYSSWCLIVLAIVKQESVICEELGLYQRALVAGYSMRSSIRLGFALITLADWRATSALLLSNLETPGLVKAATESYH